MKKTIGIPEGYEARIDGNKVIIEPKESEDERIRKEIISYIKSSGAVTNPNWIAWLEKQGEKNELRKIEQKYKVGDWVVYCGKTCKITGLNNGIFTITNQDGSYFFNQVESTTEPSFRLWTIQDAKDGDVLASDNDNRPFIYSTKTVFGNPVAYCGVRSDGLFISKSPKDHQWCLKSEVIPATKEQRDLLFSKMKEAGYEWDVEKKELRKIEQNSALREEDENIRIRLIDYLCGKSQLAKDREDGISWLKSLKERYTWKPSDEQIKALENSTGADEEQSKALYSLLDDLKKLKG